MDLQIKEKTISLIDSLKSTCQTYGMGNDGNEYKIITQVFLYKYLNDKFGYEIKKLDKRIASAEKWEIAYSELSEDDREDLFDTMNPDIPRLNPEHLISHLWNQQAKDDFDLIFDQTMIDIADKNIDIFSTQTTQNTKIPLFEKLTQYVTDEAQRAPFARALVDKLVNFSFEETFSEHMTSSLLSLSILSRTTTRQAAVSMQNTILHTLSLPLWQGFWSVTMPTCIT